MGEDVPDRVQERGPVIGLVEDFGVAQTLRRDVPSVAGGVKDAQIGPEAMNPAHQLRPVPPRHHHIGDQEIEGLAGGDDLQGRLAARRHPYLVPGILEHGCGVVADIVVVVGLVLMVLMVVETS